MLRALARVGLIIALPAVAGERLTDRAYVLDGDTLAVGGLHARLEGAAAPELAHYDQPGERGGETARAFMVEPVESQTVVCDSPRSARKAAGWAGARSTPAQRGTVRRHGTARGRHCRFQAIACRGRAQPRSSSLPMTSPLAKICSRIPRITSGGWMFGRWPGSAVATIASGACFRRDGAGRLNGW